MHTQRTASVLPHFGQVALAVVLLCAMLLTSACGGDVHLQQQASQSQAKLDHQLQQAQKIGVPASLLQPLIQQEQQLSRASTPFNPFADQATNAYYHNLARRYTQLALQVQAIMASSTEQSQAQAQQDMQNFQTTLAQRRSQGLPVDNFTRQYNQSQALMASAKYPKDYASISHKAQISKQSLDLMQSVSGKLATFKQTIGQMQTAHLDVTLLQSQLQNDQQAFVTGATLTDFQKLNVLLNAQYQQAVVNSTQAIPYVTAAKLKEFDTQIKLLQTYGMNADPYQKRLNADRAKVSQTMSIQDFANFSQQVDTDVAAMHHDLVQGQARYLIKQFHQEVDAWGKAHPYHDKFNGQNYTLDSGYAPSGIGSDIDLDLSWASTSGDFQGMVDEANNALFNLHMMETDYRDKTPFDRVHATDLQLLNHYKLKGQVIVISLAGQALRLYQDGKLVRGMLVTTGRTERPSLPGVWSVMNRQSPTVFKSIDPQGSPYWYPDTPIHYAILYHHGGYFLHDSWWRANYGPGTQFPHSDSGGDQVFSGNGSHGCVNIQENQAAWLYNATNWNTTVVIY